MNKSVESTENVKQVPSTSGQSVTIPSFPKPLRNKTELLGVWASDNKELLTVEINIDSIYYTEHFESYKYDLKGDSIFVRYPDFMFTAKVYFTKDTMIMESDAGQSKYYRFKD